MFGRIYEIIYKIYEIYMIIYMKFRAQNLIKKEHSISQILSFVEKSCTNLNGKHLAKLNGSVWNKSRENATTFIFRAGMSQIIHDSSLDVFQWF